MWVRSQPLTLSTPHPHPFQRMWVRSSIAFYGNFNLDMDRSPGFGSAPTDSFALLRLGFPSAPHLWCLTSPASVTRRTVLQKVRGSTFKVVPQLVNIWFQVLFHSPPGVLFTFPSQYYALSVTKEYLALRGGPRVFSQGSTCLDLLWIPPCQSTFHLRGFHPLWPAFPGRSVKSFGSIPRSEPRSARTPVWALPVSLAATSRITCCFLFLRLLRCFSSPGSPPNVMYWR